MNATHQTTNSLSLHATEGLSVRLSSVLLPLHENLLTDSYFCFMCLSFNYINRNCDYYNQWICTQ
jgi:hypothetical protein